MVTLKIHQVQYVELFKDQKPNFFWWGTLVTSHFCFYILMDSGVILCVLEPMELLSLMPDVNPALSNLDL